MARKRLADISRLVAAQLSHAYRYRDKEDMEGYTMTLDGLNRIPDPSIPQYDADADVSDAHKRLMKYRVIYSDYVYKIVAAQHEFVRCPICQALPQYDKSQFKTRLVDKSEHLGLPYDQRPTTMQTWTCPECEAVSDTHDFVGTEIIHVHEQEVGEPNTLGVVPSKPILVVH